MVNETGGMSEATGDYEGREGLDYSVDLMVDREKMPMNCIKRSMKQGSSF